MTDVRELEARQGEVPLGRARVPSIAERGVATWKFSGFSGMSSPRAAAVEGLVRAGFTEAQITSLTSVPYPDGVLVKSGQRSWFRWLALAGGMAGAVAGFGLAAGTAWLYPVQTGDKPIIALYPTAIITFEVAMLFAIIGTMVGMFLEMGLPALGKRPYDPAIAEGCIGISVDHPCRRRAGVLRAGRKAGECIGDDRRPSPLRSRGSGRKRSCGRPVPSGSLRRKTHEADCETGHPGRCAAADGGALDGRAALLQTLPGAGSGSARRHAVPVSGTGDRLARIPNCIIRVTPTAASLAQGQIALRHQLRHVPRPDLGKPGPVGMKLKPPPPGLDHDRGRERSDAHIFKAITFGFGRMPPFKDKLSPAERWDLVNYLRSRK